MREAAGAADLVITTGGVSVGEKDYLPQALHMTGAEMIFNRISIKPGSPTTFSVLNGTPVLSLTGTPFGAAVNFHLLARPVLAAVGRDASIEASYEYARFRGVFGKESSKTRYIRGFLRGGEAFAADGSGRYPAAEKAADVKASDAKTNLISEVRTPGAPTERRMKEEYDCFIEIPAGSTGLSDGERVRVVSL